MHPDSVEHAYLKDKAHYNDLYDRMTVDACRQLEARMAPPPLTETANAANEYAKLLCTVTLYFERGDWYARKEERIRQWMDRDLAKDEVLRQAVSPRGIICPQCRRPMACQSKDLQEDNGTERVLFFFVCAACLGRRIIFDNGTEYRGKPSICPCCQSKMGTSYARPNADEIVLTVSCSSCGHVETDVMNLKAQAAEPVDNTHVADRARFCMTEEEGNEYLSCLDVLERIAIATKAQDERSARQHLFDEIAKLRRLTIVEVKTLLMPALHDRGFGQFDLGTPVLRRDIQVPFQVQECTPGRSEDESIKSLGETITQALDNTNWKLMSGGITYRLGILTGYLRGLESEHDLLRLVEVRLKKRENRTAADVLKCG